MPAPGDLEEVTRSLSAPLGDLIAAVGRGVAEAQQALDRQALETFKAVYNLGDASYSELRQIGYQPTWYRIPEVTAELYVSLSASGEERLRVGGPAAPAVQPVLPEQAQGRIQLYATPVDASYSNTYNYNLKASSLIKFRIVPVPPAPQAEGLQVVPDLVGMTYDEARAVLDQLRITHTLADAGYRAKGDEPVEAIEPKPGSLLTAAQAVRLTLGMKPAPAAR